MNETISQRRRRELSPRSEGIKQSWSNINNATISNATEKRRQVKHHHKQGSHHHGQIFGMQKTTQNFLTEVYYQPRGVMMCAEPPKQK